MSQVAFVTGGNRGIGGAIARAFQSKGWKVAACASSETSKWESAPDLKLVCDVRSADSVKNALRACHQKLGALTAVVNNAGLAGTNPMDPESDDAFWHEIIRVNLDGSYFVSKYSQPYLVDGKSRIINLSSVLGLKGVPDGIAYCAAKHGVLGLTKSLAHFFAPRKITVNAICPGWTRTEMAMGRMKEIGFDEETLKSAVPLGRFIEPEEVAALALYLASDDASGMTGQSFTIDGGVLA